MKVAIVTLFGNFNYGNRLQNYALQEAITSLGHQVITINADYDTSCVKRFVKQFLERTKGGRKIKSITDLKRDRAFDAFTRKYIPTVIYHNSNGEFPESVNLEFDAFVTGSDQVWNPLFWKDSDLSCELRNYFLAFSKNKTVSYAASYGIDVLPIQWLSRIEPLLKEFHFISVREQSGKDITESMGREATVVLDPTLLLSADEWRKTESSMVDNRKYVLTYFLGKQSNTVYSQIKDRADKINAEIINLYDSSCKYYSCGPDTFLELIDKAEIVYTDSFHATVFSLLFHTEFAVFNRKHGNKSDMSSRITTLLGTVGIDGGVSVEDSIYYHRNFSEYDTALDKEKGRSMLFLRQALSQ